MSEAKSLERLKRSLVMRYKFGNNSADRYVSIMQASALIETINIPLLSSLLSFVYSEDEPPVDTISEETYNTLAYNLIPKNLEEDSDEYVSQRTKIVTTIIRYIRLVYTVRDSGQFPSIEEVRRRDEEENIVQDEDLEFNEFD